MKKELIERILFNLNSIRESVDTLYIGDKYHNNGDEIRGKAMELLKLVLDSGVNEYINCFPIRSNIVELIIITINDLKLDLDILKEGISRERADFFKKNLSSKIEIIRTLKEEKFPEWFDLQPLIRSERRKFSKKTEWFLKKDRGDVPEIPAYYIECKSK